MPRATRQDRRVSVSSAPAAAAGASSSRRTRRRGETGAVLLVPVLRDDFEGGAARGRALAPGFLDATLGRDVREAAGIAGFTGQGGEVTLVPVTGRRGVCAVMLVGLGAADAFGPEGLRSAMGAAQRRVPDGLRSRKITVCIDPGRAPWKAAAAGKGDDFYRLIQALVEGWILGGYAQSEHRTEKKPPPIARLDVRLRAPEAPRGRAGKRTAAASPAAIRRATRAGEAVARGVALARDLANAPGNVIYPATLARRARSLARSYGLACRVLDPAALRRERMGALLGVGQGSAASPRFIVLEYRPRGNGASARPLVLVGKAVTFDTGGISIKPAKGMEEMKADMSGGAAVLAAMTVIAELELPCRVVGLIPSAENMPGARAIKPGDVLVSRSGLRIEVTNTDAEGRLILADALDYARRFKPRLVVDLATLTGACVVALGDVASGVMANDDAAVKAVESAAAAAGEKVWQLPLHKEYFEAIRSDTADLKNSGGRYAGAITAAAFLSRFIEGVPWAHLDIAGPAWSRRTRGHLVKGATGVGVATLVALARQAGR